MDTALAHNVAAHIAPAGFVRTRGCGSSRRTRALSARMERPGTVGEMIAAASALCAQGVRFYAEVETTAAARIAGVQQAWICSDLSLVQLGEAPEECFHPMSCQDGRTAYVTADEYGRYLWTAVPSGRAWIVFVEWKEEWSQ